MQTHLALVNKFKEAKKKKIDKKSDRSIPQRRARRARRAESGNSSGNAAVSSPNWTRSSRASRMSRTPLSRHLPAVLIVEDARISQRAAFSRLIQYPPCASPPPRLSSRYERRKENPLESPSRLGIKNGKKGGKG